MTQQEHRSFEICIKEIKQIAIRNQLYEFAVISRDLERELSSMITNDQLASEWHKIAVIDSFQYYEKIERIINQYSTSKIDESLRSSFKELHDVVMRPVIRQEMISKILGDEENIQ